MNGVVVDAPQGPLHVSTVHQYTQETLLKGLDNRQSDDTTPSGNLHGYAESVLVIQMVIMELVWPEEISLV